jgi:hypothetical protein
MLKKMWGCTWLFADWRSLMNVKEDPTQKAQYYGHLNWRASCQFAENSKFKGAYDRAVGIEGATEQSRKSPEERREYTEE